MTNPSHSIPEPVFPEHQLLADAAPEIELSAGFRSQVLSECAASHAWARKILLAKLVAVAFTSLAAAVFAYNWWNQPPEEPSIPPQVPHAAAPSSAPESLSPHPLSTAAEQPPVEMEPLKESPQP